MKKILNIILMAVTMMAMSMGVSSCSSSEDEDLSFSEKRVTNYITGHRWYLDHSKRSEYRFYRNHLVACLSVGGSVAPGMLTYPETNYFGTWSVVDGKLITTFTVGTYEGFDWNNILYGTLTITNIRTDFKSIDATDPNGDVHELSSFMLKPGASSTFADYSDASDHDDALVGTWRGTATSSSGERVRFTMTIEKKGKVRFEAPSMNLDYTTNCTTKNGHVAFDFFLTPQTGSRSYVYIRDSEELVLYDEKYAQSWTWQKVE